MTEIYQKNIIPTKTWNDIFLNGTTGDGGFFNNLPIQGTTLDNRLVNVIMENSTFQTSIKGPRVKITSSPNPEMQIYDADYLRLKITNDRIVFYDNIDGSLSGAIIGTVDGLDVPNLFPSANWDIGGEYVNKLAGDWVVGDYLRPATNNLQSLGTSSYKFNTVYRTNEISCALPTTNSATDVFKKIKKPIKRDGDYGERHYFEVEDFPDEMKVLNDKKEPDIELTRVLGLTVQAVRELIEKVGILEQKLDSVK